MLYGKKDPPITFMDSNALKQGLNSFFVLNLSIGKSYYQGGHNIWLKLCDQVLKSCTKHPHTSTKIANSTIPSCCYFRGCGNAALKWPLRARGYLYFSLSSPTFTSSPTVHLTLDRPEPSLSLPPMAHLELSSNSIDESQKKATPLISPSILREQLHWLPIP
jgi:hypothetical protein